MRGNDFRMRPPLGGFLVEVIYADNDRTHPPPPRRDASDPLPGCSSGASVIDRTIYRNAAALPGTAV